MPRRHLFSLQFAHALREACISEAYSKSRFSRDVIAGITVGIIAIPLSMALAIASGVAPQHGLYTAIIAGFIIALAGGSRFSISGPTAAFVVILAPISRDYGLAGLLIATLLAGLMLIGMGLARQGRLIEYISESVTIGFTGGIAVVIATLQIKDLLGLEIENLPDHFLPKAATLLANIPNMHWPSFVVGLTTLFILITWKRLKVPIPPHLPAIIIGTAMAAWFNNNGWSVDTLGSRFTYLLPNGSVGNGVPAILPNFDWPWRHAGATGEPYEMSWSMFTALLPSAFAIAMLGAIESLLCAVVLDGMTGRRHSANSELLAQGIGNVIVPFFGGISATAAIARSTANYRAGAESPVSGMIHALVVLASLLFLAPILSYLPMSGMAALLLIVAWNMSEAPKGAHLLKTAPMGDIMVFLTCLSLTIVFDMVIAITAGVLLAALLFMRDMAQMTKLTDITNNPRLIGRPPADGWRVYRITGPLFFAAADRIFAELAYETRDSRGVILQLDAVTILDAGGLSALLKFISSANQHDTCVYMSEWQFQPLKTLARAKILPMDGVRQFYPNLSDALDAIPKSELT